MKRSRLAVALAALSLSPPALADMLEVRPDVMEFRIARAEVPAMRQSGEVAARDARIGDRAPPGVADEAARDAPRAERISVGGLIEIEAEHAAVEGGGDTSNAATASVELAIDMQFSEWVAAESVVKYEDDSESDGDLDIDSAVVSIADPEGPWFIAAGKYTLPFGAFPSVMISDPLTLELAETTDSAIEVGVTTGTFTVSAFAFRGDRQGEVRNFGVSASLSTAIEGAAGAKAGLGYLNDLAEADTIVDAGWVAAGDDRVPAWIASAELALGNLALMAEYLSATKGFASAGDETPSAYMVEAVYAFNAMGRPASAALGYQRTRNARDDNWGLPRMRMLGTFMLELVEGVALGVEFKRDTDYADETTDTVTGQLAVEF